MTKVELMQKLLQEVSSMQYGAGDITILIDKAKLYVKKCFGEESEYLKRIDKLSFTLFFLLLILPTEYSLIVLIGGE